MLHLVKIILKNYRRYYTDEFNLWTNDTGTIFYDTDTTRDFKIITVADETLNKPLTLTFQAGTSNPKLSNNYAGKVSTVIADIIGEDVSVEGKYTLSYQGKRDGKDDDQTTVRIFLSSSTKGLQEESSDFTKLTEFSGTLNLTTSNGKVESSQTQIEETLKGNLIGLEHQILDNPSSKNSILLNTGEINIGKRLDPYEGNKETDPSELNIKVINQNMIGIMIDYAAASTKNLSEGSINKNNKTINAGEINIDRPFFYDDEVVYNPKNNIGISFEESTSGNDMGTILKDDVYIGKINIKDNTENNYGFRMGNIYSASPTYFDETKIKGKVDGDKIIIDNDNGFIKPSNSNIKTENEEQYIEYTSDIVVAGNQNVGMVVGKSLSSNASDYKDTFGKNNVNPIANFENISIKVDGNQTIGFVRDKNYSDNNKNDMVITDSNLNNKNGKVRFGASAKNSVLFRSEMYGITNETTINVTPEETQDTTTEENIREEESTETTPAYNVVIQAMVQSWDKDGDGIKDTNSSGTVTNGIEVVENGEKVIKGSISGTANNMIGMMASGTITNTDASWQNEDKFNNGKALAINNGKISLNGDNNIGMAIIDNNLGNNSGTIEIEGEYGVGVYNTGTFTNNGTIKVTGKDGIAIYNKQEIDKINRTISEATLNLDGTIINIADNSEDTSSKGATAIYSEGGIINFGNTQDKGTTIIGENNSSAGVYTKGDTSLNGNVNISGTKAGIIADSGTASITGGNITYSGEGFALYTKDGENGAKGKITLDSSSTLTLGGNSYGVNIDVDKTGDNQAIKFNNSKINIISNDVTIFNIDGKGKYTINSGDGNFPGTDSLKDYIGTISEIKDNGKLGYKIASIENGTINLDSSNGNNEKFLQKYRFKKSIVNMTTDTNLSLTNTEADTYFSGEVIGIGISSNTSKDETPTELDDTQINIDGSNNEEGITLVANRMPNSSEENNNDNSTKENDSNKSTIGAYIDYGIINLTKGHIIVEKSTHQNDTIYDNGIGIYSKNGSKVTVNKDSSITVYGNNGIGIYGEATKEFYTNEEGVTKNKFGGVITQLNIENKGTIDVSSGTSGIGIYAYGSVEDEKNKNDEENEIKENVINSGTIIVGGGTDNDSSVGIYGINVDITNTGNIQVGCQHNSDTVSHAGVGIYAQNSNVTIGDATNKKVEFTLGDFATGIYLDGDSNLELTNNLVFNSLAGNTTDRIGIYATNKATGELITSTPSEIKIDKDIDMSGVIGGKAVVVDGRDISNTGTITISGNNGRGLRVLNNGMITNNGTINITNSVEVLEDKENNIKNPSSIGMVAADTKGTINNTGTININSTNGIGIYVDNTQNNDETKNIIKSIGNINLNGEKNIGVVVKDTELTLTENAFAENESTKGIIFGENSKNSIGIYADAGSTITINKEISKTFTETQTNNILIAGVGNSEIINNKTITVETSNENSSEIIDETSSNNIGIYLKAGGKYINGTDGNIEVKNGNIGIYSDIGANTLENINITSDSQGLQTIGVFLNGENQESKNISGDITLTNTNNDVVQGKNIGVYANNSNVVVNNTLTLDNDESNGTGLYLNNSTLSGSGTVKITGAGKDKNPDETIEDIPNSVGIYYTSTSENPPITNNSIKKVEIDKSNTIGVYVANGSTLTKQSSGGIRIGTDESNQKENITGLVASSGSTINNNGTITLGNVKKGIGIAALGGITTNDEETTINNSGNIEIGTNSVSGTGIFLTGNSKLDNSGTIIIKENTADTTSEEHLGIGIYAKGEEVTIGSTGNFDMEKGNIAIYSDGTNISSDINLLHKDEDNNALDTNSGTTALVIKSDIKSEEEGITRGTTVGGTDEKRMNITLAKGSTGIYALDSGVIISNVSIDAKANEGKDKQGEKDLLSYGIYLHSEENGNYSVSNTDISLVKGVGIVVDSIDIDNLQENEKNTKLTLSGSTINIDSYSETNESETGIGIYTQSGNIALTGGNTINTTYGVGVFGGSGSDISIGIENEEDKKDILNLIGYSVGVYSNGGSVTLGADTNIVFQKGQDYGKEKEITSKGVGAYVIDGNINSSANINLAQGNDKADGIVGLLGKQSQEGTEEKEFVITSSGNINLFGKSVVGIAGIGLEANSEEEEKEESKLTITNTSDGSINISGTYSEEEDKAYLSTGIYGKDVNIINDGSITVGNYATGIYYAGTKANDIKNSKTINISGTESTGIILNGVAGDVSLGNVSGNTDRNLGIYLDNYSSNSTNIGNIELGNQSMGLYINNSSTTIKSSIDNVILIGNNGIGIASVGDSSDGADTVTITNNGNISVGDNGIAVYVQESTLNMDSLAGVTAGKNGAVLYVNNGTLNLKTTINELTFNGNTGIVLENGGNIKFVNSTDEEKISNITVTSGGTGILVKGENTGRPDIFANTTTIDLGSGVYTTTNNGIEEYKYSVGAYYQNANLDNKFNIDIVRQKDSHHTIGTIYDRTYGTINNFNATMDSSISDSIGTIIRRDGNDIVDNDKTVTLNAGEDGILANINGNHNIGIAGKNSNIIANGNIKVESTENKENTTENKSSIGVYLTGDNKNWTHSYTGNGDIEAGSNSYGIYAKNYNVTHNGNISASGNGSIGIASVIEDKDGQAHDHPHNIIIGDKTNSKKVSDITVTKGAIGIFGRDTDIEIVNGNLNISEDSTTGIASLKDGNITFNGSTDISGENSVGIYKNTVLDTTTTGTKGESSNTITVGRGEWNIGDLSNGIVAISREKDKNGSITATGNSITIDNNSNMTLGAGAIGIYSAGKNTVSNKGDITVGEAITDGEETLTSIGIYMANGVGGNRPRTTGENFGTIKVTNNGGVGIQAAGYVDFINTKDGKITISNGAEGMHASLGATVTNEGNITVTGKGTGMLASGNGSQAINNGTITLKKDDSMLTAEELTDIYNTSLIGMAATNGGYIKNNGTINVNDGVGMYIDEDSTFTNSGTINVYDGVGIMGVGQLNNTGNIVIKSENSNAVGTVELNENLSNKGSLAINREEGILEVNDNFSNIGGILETDYNIKLNNPTIDITAGGAGFIAPNVSGDIKLDSNFALEGDGLSFSVEDFIKPDADINVNTSPLFKTDITEGDLTVNKVDYKDITVGTQFDNRDNALDDILVSGGADADILKNLNYYLDSLGNTTVFNSEANRLLGAVGGNIYSNIQSRMQDISRNFDSSFVEMIESENPTYENSKYHLIYTDGDYKNSNKNVINYNYNIMGLNYMKEYDSTEYGKKYGHTFGFTGTKFKLDDFSGSEEDVYSLRGGVHRINYFDNRVSWLTRAELGYNHHRVERKINIPNVNINNRDWYSSYQVSLDNRLRKEIFADERNNLGVYTALNLEYGLFDDINEKGDLELKVKSNDYFSSKAMLGLDGKLSKPLNDSWSIRLNGDVNYSYDFGNNYDENEVKLRSTGDYYSLSSELKSRDVVSGRLSIALDKSDYFTISLHGQASKDFRREEDYWNVGLTFIYRFNHYAVPEKFLDMRTYFEFDKSEIKAKDKENIKEMAEYINENNMQGTLLIEGHTDNKGTNPYNDKLSLERANSVKEEFEKTLDNDNIQIKVMGYGEDRPAYKNINESTRSKNRRAQVNILNK